MASASGGCVDGGDGDLMAQVRDKIEYGEELIVKLSDLEVEGVHKLQRKIRQEIMFLTKLEKSGRIKKEQLSCSNLRHLGSVVDSALRPGAGVVALSSPVHSPTGAKLNVDLIQDQGRTWTKVIARNPRSLSALCEGNASFGARCVLDQAKDYMKCARLHPCFYQTPQVVFEFVSGIEDILAAKLQEMGVCVRGNIISTRGRSVDYHEGSSSGESDDDIDQSDHTSDGGSDDDDDNVEGGGSDSDIGLPVAMPLFSSWTVASECPQTLNLDVTTMMAYISNLTNGHHNYKYRQPLLSQQAGWEAKRPQKPLLDQLFKDKTLMCCEAAWADMSKIVGVLGGPQEKQRAEELRRRLTVMPDDTNGADDSKRGALRVRGRVRLRSKVVFNFGQRIKAVTVSANEGFVRAAKQQGVAYAVVIHECRALTEQKEATAQYCLLPTS